MAFSCPSVKIVLCGKAKLCDKLTTAGRQRFGNGSSNPENISKTVDSGE
jgi:hypothetical protein